MNIALWIVQGLLAFVFLMAGGMKMRQSKENLLASGQMGFVEDFSQNAIRMIGVAEVLGAIGLILPMLLDILPVFTPLAALGLALTMVGAAYTHLRRNEMSKISMNGALLALAVFVAVGRLWIESVV